MATNVVLGYWDMRGIGEPIRLILEHAGACYDDRRILTSKPKWLKFKTSLGYDFPNLPFYQDEDVKITHSKAILKHLGRKYGLDGSTVKAKAEVDMMLDQAVEIRKTRFFCRTFKELDRRVRMADSGGGGRYFCHQCNVEIPHVSEDFCCPVCNSGFIEELRNSDLSEPGAPLHEPDPMDQIDFPGQLANFLPPGMLHMGMDMGRPGRYHVHRQGPMRPMLRGGHQQDGHLEHFLQELIFNVTGMGVAGGGGVPGVQFHLVPGHQGAGGVQIHGHPGDYAWGTGGLDAIITQLLNQMDGSGPPPMAQENIRVKIRF
ncbi:E3 ubiquitin-protein ligase RNF126 isoform X2 [Eurytemora carolleeae]|uniref:E3 ubiquitin-protein ligase RNF126 isoform X2 n=1 Tax=Eurytemora carolleeae TaxID=1294199 RepID=UPI000C78625C|nr:E3 ubiquitin-protein ligase RNF126 isoform X2 [Eurytemora carolleeae]|eukprot:XP_023324890.1 E3 ubiquitin-protein ligase RNF126-like isoform X2 [Eurytemora affinis]